LYYFFIGNLLNLCSISPHTIFIKHHPRKAYILHRVMSLIQSVEAFNVGTIYSNVRKVIKIFESH